jgi:glycosyltransferase involved in cell wall biosynthesis
MEYKACVLMPVYNSEDTVAEVLESIIKQSFQDYKILVVDDGSTDNTPAIITKYKSSKLQVLRFKEKIGIVNALNWSLSEITEPYIIRADARLLSKPDRFQKLITFMESNPEVGVCGSLMATSIENNEEAAIPIPCEHDDIVAQMLIQNPLARGSMIIRTSVLQGKGFRLSDKYKLMEDYDLWYRMRNETRFANINEALVLAKYKSSRKDSDSWNKHFRAEALSFYLSKLLEFGIKPTDKELKLHLDLSNLGNVKKLSNPQAYKEWIVKLKEHNNAIQFFPVENFKTFLNGKWTELFPYVAKKRTKKIIQYLKADGRTNFQVVKMIIVHRIKALIG